MPQKYPTRSIIGYTVYAIIGTITELALLFAVLYGILPLFRIQVPLWVTLLLAAVLLGISYFTYHMGRRALRKKTMFELESMIGAEGIVLESFERTGYVRIGNELWKANSPEPVKTGDAVIITAVKGFRIEVAPRPVAGSR
jgi:membrane-bound ClpP family serine protease